MKRGLASLLLVVAGVVLALVRWIDPALPPRDGAPREPSASRQSAPSSAPEAGAPAPSGGLRSVGDAERDAQIARVVTAMDATGRPPAGVVQGGRRRGPKGVFDNLEGRLKRQPAGYYVESDVWPRGSSGRGAERLVFGRAGEVYYTRDHYRSFVQLRGAP